MDSFLDYVEKYKFAILGTAMVHIIFFFYTFFATLDTNYVSLDPTTEVIVPLDDVELDPKIMEMLEVNKQPEQHTNLINTSVNENDRRDVSRENFSREQIDKAVEDEIRDLEQSEFDRRKSEHPADISDSGTEEKTDNKDKRDKKENATDGGSAAPKGEVLVSFELGDRKEHYLPIPGYTCNSSGRVVIDIKVDKSGTVKFANFNSGLSAGATECMIDKALRYAKESRFNYNSSTTFESGTITYKFDGH